MPRYKAILEYDGAGFYGFQRQAEARTVQGEVEAALSRVGWAGPTILGAGRTDTGVHAAGQVIAFDLEWGHGPDDLLRALNANLPADAAVTHLEPCAPDFHPRYQARGRRYRYTIYNQPVRSPLAARYAWQVWPALSLTALHEASLLLLGRHDFAAFGSDPDQGTYTIRTVRRAEWAQTGEWFYFDIQAEAFLYRMVRSLVGALKKVGTSEWAIAEFAEVFHSRDRARRPPIAPAHGLCLMEVSY